MRCPRCDHKDTFVLKTTTPDHKLAGVVKKRRRKCPKCNRPFMTYEISEADFDRLCALIMLEGPTRSPLRTKVAEPPKSSDAKPAKES